MVGIEKYKVTHIKYSVNCNANNKTKKVRFKSFKDSCMQNGHYKFCYLVHGIKFMFKEHYYLWEMMHNTSRQIFYNPYILNIYKKLFILEITATDVNIYSKLALNYPFFVRRAFFLNIMNAFY